MNYSDDIQINKYNLPDECARHASLFYKISEDLAIAKAELDSMQDELKLHLSECDIEIRSTWNDSFGKMTEAGIAARILMLSTVTSRKEAIREKEKEVALLDAAKGAFEHRKYMLNNLTSLFIGSFYSTPEGSRPENKTSSIERELRRARREKEDD